LRAAVLLALMAGSAIAAAEVPARVGRLSLVQGPVSISTEDGEGQSDALINWPVTTENRIVTERGARTEIRVGSTAVRLDGDSSLDVIELDDDSLRLHLNYGSASVRVRNPEVLEGFEIATPHGRVTLREPGRIRVDAERQRDASTVDVFEGVAVVDSFGSRLAVRAGRSAEMHPDQLGTAFAQRTSFDDWALLRDRQDDRVTSDRYVTSEMTGYEELDRYGSWRDDSEYGPLWVPRGVSAGWAPYRDGRWTWVAPWGWTWIDNAPWGYAPSHYGRWVLVNQRWSWAPGRNIGRPVWAPALVGWVGGSNWSLSFNSGSPHRPAQGWYPLGPHDVFVPGYRSSHDHVRYINRHARNDGDRRRGDRQRGDNRRQGLTVVPHEHFNRRVPVVVPQAPRAVVTTQALQTAPAAAPAAPRMPQRERLLRRHADDRQQPDGMRERRGVQVAVPAAPVVQSAPVQQPPRRDWNPARDERRQDRAAHDAERQSRMAQDAQRQAGMEQEAQRLRMEQEAQRSRMEQEAQRSRMEQEAQRSRMEQEAQRQSRMQHEAQRQWRMEQDARRQGQGEREERRIQVERPQPVQQPAPHAAPQPAPAPAPQMAPAPAPRETSPVREHRRQQMEERGEKQRQGVRVNLD
jgi:hypothetical protein